MGKIVLASSSPRRQFILKQNNYVFEIIPSPYVEDHSRTDFSYDFIESLAENKARAVLPLIHEPCKIIGADTIVVLNKKTLGKPHTRENAIKMLQSLSGKTHTVVTAIAVIDSESQICRKISTTSDVEFFPLTTEQIEYYVDNFKPFDKAGSYGIQEMPEGYIKSYSGSLDNIIGICPNALKKVL